jgi:GAF domain-containing protein
MRSAGAGRKRGSASKRVELLAKLAPLLRAPVDVERMLRSIASLLAAEIGQYCVIDCIDRNGELRRVEIEHADASRRARLRVVCEDAAFPPTGRVVRMLAKGTSELVSKVEGARARALSDLALLRDESVKSYMAATVSCGGAPLAVVTLVVTQGTRRYGADELGMLEASAEWIGLGLENALRRETLTASRTRSGIPPRGSEPPASRSEQRAKRAGERAGGR